MTQHVAHRASDAVAQDNAREALIRATLNIPGATTLGPGDTAFLLSRLDKARAENENLQRTFDLMWDADQRAIKAWQAANPGNEMVWPDRSKLIMWLLERYDTRVKDLLEANNREVERRRAAEYEVLRLSGAALASAEHEGLGDATPQG